MDTFLCVAHRQENEQKGENGYNSLNNVNTVELSYDNATGNSKMATSELS